MKSDSTKTREELLEELEQLREVVKNQPASQSEDKEVEMLIEPSKDHLHQIINSVADPIFVKDRKHRWILLNDAYCRFMGYSREELIGKSDYDYFPKEEADTFWEKDEEVFKTGKENHNIENFTDANGVRHVLATKKTLYEDAEGHVFIVGIIRDITEMKQTEEDLRTAGAFLDSVLDNIPDMIFVKEAKDLRFVRFNKAGEKLLGYSRDYMKGKNDYDFFPKEEAEFFTAKDREVLNRGNVVDISEEPIHTKSEKRFLHTKKVPILDSSGKPQYLLGISEDITQRKRTEDQLRELTIAMEHTLGAIAKVDREGKLIYLNKTYAHLFGYQVEDFIGKSFESVIFHDDVDTVREGYKRMISEGKAEVEVRASRNQGTLFNLQLLLVRTNHPSKPYQGGFCFAKDITERKYKEALEIKSDLISMISHELRTPLHSLREGIKILLEGLVGDVNGEQEEVLKTSQRSVDRLIRLVNSALDFQKLEAGVVEFDMGHHQVLDIVDEIIKALTPLADPKGLSLDVQTEGELPIAYCDRDRVSQVLFNLIHNAIKFTSKGSITVNVVSKKEVLKISITDCGIGIKDEDIPKIFRSFAQLEIAKTIAQSGTGLGLAISKKIIEQQGGDMWVESEYERGSTFSFTLPLMSSMRKEEAFAEENNTRR